MVTKLFPLVPVVCVAMVLASCGTGQTPSPVTPRDGKLEAPSLAELSDLLDAEFVRLGIDPSKIVAAAPSGSGNAVFDLSATILGDGSGGVSAGEPGSGRAPYRPENGLVQGTAPTQKTISAITGIELTWTERIIGDYDQNGEVNLTDITPMVLNWGSAVAYDDPALHGGFDGWPSGDADGAGAANWRRARIDGDGNGEINTTDITPIVMHFHQSLDGYRIYRKAPGETQFTMLPPPVPVDADVTLAHPDSPDNTAPVRYSLSDDEATPGGLGDGVYQYYVAPYDKTSGAEGAASGIVHVDIVAGTVNQSPVAQLSISPGFAGAPAEVTLDASGSYDVDGTITAYEWDFDADGVVDWLSTDPLPDESSSGDVNGITVVSPGVVKATYNQGFADWFYPDVTVADTEGLWSMPADARLGLSGWELELLNESTENYEIPFEIVKMSVDPRTGRLVLAGKVHILAAPEGFTDGGYFAWEQADGSWEVEQFLDGDSPEWYYVDGPLELNYGWPLIKDVMWGASGQPIVLFDSREDSALSAVKSRVWTAERLSVGQWNKTLRFAGTEIEGNSLIGNSAINSVLSSDGKLYTLVSETLNDLADEGVTLHGKLHVMNDGSEPWPVEYTGWDTGEKRSLPAYLSTDYSGDWLALLLIRDSEYPGIWGSRWVEGEGLVAERLDAGDLPNNPNDRTPLGFVAAEDGVSYALYRYGSTNNSDHHFFQLMPDRTEDVVLTVDPLYGAKSMKAYDLLKTDRGIGFFIRGYQHLGPAHIVEYMQYESGNWVRETVMQTAIFVPLGYTHSTESLDGKPYVIIRHGYPNGESQGFSRAYLLGRRIDPRD